MKTMVLASGFAVALFGHANATTDVDNPALAGVFASLQDSGTWITAPLAQPGEQLARRGRGADDPAGDDHGQHGTGHAERATETPVLIEMARRGRGRDDLPGHG